MNVILNNSWIVSVLYFSINYCREVFFSEHMGTGDQKCAMEGNWVRSATLYGLRILPSPVFDIDCSVTIS